MLPPPHGTRRPLFILAIAWLIVGCTTTRPPERFPGFADALPESLCVIRESDHVFIDSIDGKSVPQFDVNTLNPGTYRQFQVPAGTRVLTTFYRLENNLETLSAGPRQVEAELEPGKRYRLEANRVGVDVSVGSTLRVANWRPEVVEERTGQQAGMAAVER